MEPVPHRGALAAALILAACILCPPAYGESESAADVRRSARLWILKYRPDLARVAYEKLLVAQTDDPHALLGLGLVELDAGHGAKANEHLARLRQVHPDDPAVAHLADAIRIAGADRIKWATALRLAETGETEQALALFAELFPTGPPQGDLGIEYYGVVGDLDSRWAEARSGFESLLRATPDDPPILLALARLLLDRDATLDEGFRMLASLSVQDGANHALVMEVWRRALVKAGAKAPLFSIQQFLALLPDDQDVAGLLADRPRQEQLAEQERLRSAEQRRAKAWRELQKLQFAAAGRRLLENRALLAALAEEDAKALPALEPLLLNIAQAHPDHSVAIGNLGLLRLQQHRPGEAWDLLARARTLERVQKRDTRWKDAMSSALAQQLLVAAVPGGDARLAERRVHAALGVLDGDLEPACAYAEALSKQEHGPEAEQLYHQVLALEPLEPKALSGLSRWLSAGGRRSEAFALLDRAQAQDRKSARKLDPLRAELLRDEAASTLAAGNRDAALRALDAAQALAPRDPWLRYDLAKLYVRLEEPERARKLMAQGSARVPADEDVHYAQALLLSSLGDDEPALRAITRVPIAARSAGMHDLVRRLQLGLQLAAARQLNVAADGAAAGQVLQAAAASSGGDPEPLAQIADTWIELSQPQRAVDLMRPYTLPGAAPHAQVLAAGVLNRARRDAELAPLLNALRGSPALAAEDRLSVDQVDAALALRTSESLSKQQRRDEALRALEPPLLQQPDNAALLEARAGLLADLGRHRDAVMTQSRLVELQPESLEYRVNLVERLQAAGEPSRASSELAAAVALAHRELARESVAAGAFGRLLELLAGGGGRALALELVRNLQSAHPGAAAALAPQHAGLLRDQAQASVAAGDNAGALDALAAARELQPRDPWLRRDLATAYVRLGMREQARVVMDQGLELAPGDMEMRFAQALLLASLDNDEPALEAVSGIPEHERSPGMRGLHQRLRVRAALRQAQVLAGSGDAAAAERALAQAADDAGTDDDLLQSVAAAWIELGQAGRGVHLMQQSFALDATPSPARLLAYAAILNRARHDDGELAALVAHLRTASGLTPEQRQQLDELDAAVLARTAADLRRQKRYAEGLAALAPGLRAQPGNALLLEARADLLAASSQPREASTIYRDLVTRRPDDADLRLAYADSLQEAGMGAQAKAALDELLPRIARNDSGTRRAATRRYAELKDYAPARMLVTGLLEDRPADGELLRLAGDIEQADGRYDWALAYFSEARHAGLRAAVPDPAALPELDDAITRIRKRRAGTAAAGLDWRNDPGRAGTSEFTGLELPMELRLASGYDGHWLGQVDVISASAGTLPADYDEAARFGQVQAAGPTSLAAFPGGLRTSTAGVALGLGYEADRWRADIGSSPAGFPVLYWVGGFKFSSTAAGVDYTLNLSRRPVTGSLLSYAGARDPVSGTVWGGVHSTGATLRLGYDRALWGVSFTAGGSRLDGVHVLDNRQRSFRATGYHSLVDEPGMQVTLGVAVSHARYDENLRFYTFGHGGYYSPQSSSVLSAPLEWTGRRGRWAYFLRGSGFLSRSREKTMPFYPTEPALQQAASASPLPSGFDQPEYEGGPGRGVGYFVTGSLEHRLTSRYSIGGRLEIDRSEFYESNVLTAYVRYLLDQPSRTPSFPPRPPRSYADY